MVKRVYPNSSDFENLSRLRTEAPAAAAPVDYSGVVVRKPWGYEYLWYENAAVAVWMLHLKADCATSMHCHVRKRTSLIVMSGTVVCSTFDDRYRLAAGEAVVPEPCVFHTTMVTSPGGACVMEVETPPLKSDLLRYRDNFGRAGQGYEDARQHSTELDGFEHRPLGKIGHGGTPFEFRETRLQFRSFESGQDLATHLRPQGLVVPLLGRLMAGPTVVADIGEAIPAGGLAVAAMPAVFAPVELLQICRS